MFIWYNILYSCIKYNKEVMICLLLKKCPGVWALEKLDNLDSHLVLPLTSLLLCSSYLGILYLRLINCLKKNGNNFYLVD